MAIAEPRLNTYLNGHVSVADGDGSIGAHAALDQFDPASNGRKWVGAANFSDAKNSFCASLRMSAKTPPLQFTFDVTKAETRNIEFGDQTHTIDLSRLRRSEFKDAYKLLVVEVDMTEDQKPTLRWKLLLSYNHSSKTIVIKHDENNDGQAAINELVDRREADFKRISVFEWFLSGTNVPSYRSKPMNDQYVDYKANRAVTLSKVTFNSEEYCYRLPTFFAKCKEFDYRKRCIRSPRGLEYFKSFLAASHASKLVSRISSVFRDKVIPFWDTLSEDQLEVYQVSLTRLAADVREALKILHDQRETFWEAFGINKINKEMFYEWLDELKDMAVPLLPLMDDLQHLEAMFDSTQGDKHPEYEGQIETFGQVMRLPTGVAGFAHSGVFDKEALADEQGMKDAIDQWYRIKTQLDQCIDYTESLMQAYKSQQHLDPTKELVADYGDQLAMLKSFSDEWVKFKDSNGLNKKVFGEDFDPDIYLHFKETEPGIPDLDLLTEIDGFEQYVEVLNVSKWVAELNEFDALEPGQCEWINDGGVSEELSEWVQRFNALTLGLQRAIAFVLKLQKLSDSEVSKLDSSWPEWREARKNVEQFIVLANDLLAQRSEQFSGASQYALLGELLQVYEDNGNDFGYSEKPLGEWVRSTLVNPFKRLYFQDGLDTKNRLVVNHHFEKMKAKLELDMKSLDRGDHWKRLYQARIDATRMLELSAQRLQHEAVKVLDETLRGDDVLVERLSSIHQASVWMLTYVNERYDKFCGEVAKGELFEVSSEGLMNALLSEPTKEGRENLINAFQLVNQVDGPDIGATVAPIIGAVNKILGITPSTAR